MKTLAAKRGSSAESTLAFVIALISAGAVVLFLIAPPAFDGAFVPLLNAAIPRFFISVFLFVLAIEFFPNSLISRRVPLRSLLWCVLPLLVAIVNFPFSALVRGSAQIAHIELLGLFLLKCLLIGLSEEVLFRGIIFSALLEYFKRRGRSCFLPVLLSSVVFALFHFVNLFDGAGILAVLVQAGYSFLIGAMLAVTLLKTENIWLCVFLHALFDCGGFIVADLGAGDPQDLTFWILTIFVGVLCAAEIVATLVGMVRRR